MTQAAFTNEVDASGPLQGLLIRERVAVSVKVSSKKRMLEELAELLSRQLPGMDQHTVFSTLTERERLGSTGIGHGLIWSPIGAVELHSAPGERIAEGVFQPHCEGRRLG